MKPEARIFEIVRLACTSHATSKISKSIVNFRVSVCLGFEMSLAAQLLEGK